MQAQSVFSPRYLKAADLNGQAHLVHIERVHTREDVLDPQSQSEVTRHILYLFNGPKGMMLNITQTTAVVEATGQDDTDNWPGCSLILHPIVNSLGYPTILVEAFDPNSMDANAYAQFHAAPPRRLPSGADVNASRRQANTPTVPPAHIGARATPPMAAAAAVVKAPKTKNRKRTATPSIPF